MPASMEVSLSHYKIINNSCYLWSNNDTMCHMLAILTLYILLLLLLSHFSRVRLCVTAHRRQPPSLPHLWDSPGKNTGAGCHFLLRSMKVKSESEVAQSHLTHRNPMDCSLPGSSVHGIFQARVLEWGAIAFSDCIY